MTIHELHGNSAGHRRDSNRSAGQRRAGPGHAARRGTARRGTARRGTARRRKPHPIASPHGERIDPYYWLRDDERQDAEVLAYLSAENAYKESTLAAVKPLEDKLYAEIIARLKQDDATVPYRKNGYWYYTRFEARQGAPDLCAAQGVARGARANHPGRERAGAGRAHEYYQLGALELSPNQEWLAFCEDTVGRREYTLRFKNLRSGEILAGRHPRCRSGRRVGQ